MSVIESPSSRAKCPRAPGTSAAVRGGVVLALVGGTVLVPSTAQAVEDVSSYYRVGCTVHPDDATASTHDPAGLTYDGDRNDVTTSPALHLLSGSSFAPQPSGAGGEDCAGTGTYGDLLTVGPGSSGLAAGERVQVEVSVQLDGDLAQTWGDDGDFTTIAEYTARVSVTSLDDCTFDAGMTVCDTPLDFEDRHSHQVYGITGYGVEADAFRSTEFTTNDGTDVDDYVDEYAMLCRTYPCAPVEVHPDTGLEVFTGTATLVVGDRYGIEGFLNVLASTWGNVDEHSSAAVRGFTLDITSSSGVDLAYASEGAAADTTPPVISGVDDVTVVSSDGSAVPVSWTATATDAVDGTVPVICDPASGSSFAVGTTTVTCEASDTAGNTATETFEVTVELGPTMRLGQALAVLEVRQGIKTALLSKYDAAVAAFAAGQDADGCAALQDLADLVAAQSGKKIPTDDAAALTALIVEAGTEHGC